VGAWLRASRALDPPATVEILQGEDMGRPSLLTVDIPAGSGGIAVTGTAVDL
jgi:predicted PhzF superfamily epimerase YddE/YHI9